MGLRRISRGRSKNFRPAVRRPTPYDKPGAHVIIPRPFTAGSGRLDSQPALAGPASAQPGRYRARSFGLRTTRDERRIACRAGAKGYVYGGEVTLYAAQPEPDRKPWRKRPTVQEQAFDENCRRSKKSVSRPGRKQRTPFHLPPTDRRATDNEAFQSVSFSRKARCDGALPATMATFRSSRRIKRIWHNRRPSLTGFSHVRSFQRARCLGGYQPGAGPGLRPHLRVHQRLPRHCQRGGHRHLPKAMSPTGR